MVTYLIESVLSTGKIIDTDLIGLSFLVPSGQGIYIEFNIISSCLNIFISPVSDMNNAFFTGFSVFDVNNLPVEFNSIWCSNDFHFSNQLKSINNIINYLSTIQSSGMAEYRHVANGSPVSDYWSVLSNRALQMYIYSIYWLMALIGYFSTILNQRLSIFIRYLISILNQRLFIFIVSFFSRFGISNAQGNTIILRDTSNSTSNNYEKSRNVSMSTLSLISSIGWLLYILFYYHYDIWFIKFITDYASQGLFNYHNFNIRYLLDRIRLSIVFLFTINTAVFYSTAFWLRVNFETTRSNVIFGIFSFIVSYINCVVWINLYRFRNTLLETRGQGFHPWIVRLISIGGTLRPYVLPLISVLRALVESIAFNFIAWYNFLIWRYWAMLPHANLLAIIIGTAIYLLIGTCQTYLEFRLNRFWLYGLVYQLSFSLLSFTTSGWFYLYNEYRTFNIDIFMYIASVILTLVFPLEIYREIFIIPDDIILGADNPRISWRDCFFAAFRYYITFLSFVLHTSSYWTYLYN